jgi:hypothetical protein
MRFVQRVLQTRNDANYRTRFKTQKPEHPSNARRLDTASLCPSKTLFEYSNPVSAAAEFGLHNSSVPKTRHASGPKIGVPAKWGIFIRL